MYRANEVLVSEDQPGFLFAKREAKGYTGYVSAKVIITSLKESGIDVTPIEIAFNKAQGELFEYLSEKFEC